MSLFLKSTHYLTLADAIGRNTGYLECSLLRHVSEPVGGALAGNVNHSNHRCIDLLAVLHLGELEQGTQPLSF